MKRGPRRADETTRANLAATAAEWIARRDAAGFSVEDERALHGWRAADPAHAAAFAELEAAWLALNAPLRAGRGAATEVAIETLETRQRRRRRRGALAGLAAAAALAVLVASPEVLRGPRERGAAPTVVFRPDRQVLADGSVVELAAGAAVAVEFSEQQRKVRLIRGEALFTVAKDAARPFVVPVGNVEVRAVGTEFAVRFTPEEVAVLVTEGRVAVERATAPAMAEPLLVSAGNVLRVPAEARALGPRAATAEETAASLAWRNRRVEFTATPLAEAVALMNRHNTLQLQLADRATAELRITGVFWTDDPETFARLLEASIGVKAKRAAPGAIVLGL